MSHRKSILTSALKISSVISGDMMVSICPTAKRSRVTFQVRQMARLSGGGLLSWFLTREIFTSMLLLIRSQRVICKDWLLMFSFELLNSDRQIWELKKLFFFRLLFLFYKRIFFHFNNWKKLNYYWHWATAKYGWFVGQIWTPGPGV